MPLTTHPVDAPPAERAVLDLLARVYAAEGPRVYLTAGEFEHRWRTVYPPGAPKAACLWRDEGVPAGFAWRDGRTALLVSAPGRADLLPPMLGWAEMSLPPDAGPLLVHAIAGDGVREDLLRASGYRPTEKVVILRSRPVDAFTPEPALPHGYTLRHVATEADIDSRAAVYELAFDDELMPPALHHAVTRAALYRPELDLVVVAPDGTLAAFATVWYDPANRAGIFEPVGCAPAHQRRGLARAVMHAGLRRLLNLGAATALVSTGARRAPANRLYEAVGFREVARLVAWEGGRGAAARNNCLVNAL